MNSFLLKNKKKANATLFHEVTSKGKKNNYKPFENNYEGTKLRRQIHENKRGWKLKQ